MVTQDDKYPEFPKLECNICGEKVEVPRKWLATELGNQIIIDWPAADELTKYHNQVHFDTLTQETEAYLRNAAQGS